MNKQRQNKEGDVIQDLEKLSVAVPSLSDHQLEKLRKGIATLSSILLSKDYKKNASEQSPCRRGDKCKKPRCCFSHPHEDKKKKSMEQLLIQMQDEAKELRYTTSSNRKSDSVPTPTLTFFSPETKNATTKGPGREEEEERVLETLRNIRCALNKVTWSNYDTLLAQVASLVDSLFVGGLLNDPVSAALLKMMTDHTIYTEAYGKMWSSLTEVYPCLLTAGQTFLDGYSEYYDRCRGEVVDDGEDIDNAEKQFVNYTKKKQRFALTSFLVHTMKYSSVSLEREAVTEKMHFMVSRLAILLTNDDFNGKEFEALIDDMVVFLREGWEVLYREEVWPLCVRQVEKTIARMIHFKEGRQRHKESKGRVDINIANDCNLRILYMLEDVMKDIIEQGRYHTSC